MKFFLPKYPTFLKWLYPERICKIDDEDSIYLTFDDGPVPEITPWVLDILIKFNAKATFFCIGDNIRKYPEIFERIKSEGHTIGNHTYNHLNGWKTSTADYLNNIQLTEEVIKSKVQKKSKVKEKFSNPELQLTKHEQKTPNLKLFRPPYGKIKNSQASLLKQNGYKIVMWDVISGDYDQTFSAEKCLKNVINNASSGSTIVFHDSEKAFRNLKETLPRALEYYSEKGLKFKSLKDAL